MRLLAAFALVALFSSSLALHLRSNRRKEQQMGPQPVGLSRYVNETVMIVGAHPDDLETNVGGTVALLTQQGTRVVYVLTTNGDKGWSKDFNMTSERLAGIRYDEQMAAAAVLNVSNVVMLDYEDGLLNNQPEAEVRQRISAAIRTFKPVAIFTWSPVTSFDQYQNGLEHPDHRTTGQIVLDAVYPSARDFLAWPMLYQAGLLGWKVQEVYLFTFDSPQLYVDITSVIPEKIQALSQHYSQYDNATALAMSVKEAGQDIASQVGITGFAEGFCRIVELS